MAPAASAEGFPGAAETSVLRELAVTYQIVISFDADALKRFRVTPAQADVILALGHNPGQSCRELSDETRINRGSLSSVLERLEARKLVSRSLSRKDRRKTVIRLTRQGDALFDRLAPERGVHIASRFDRIDARKQGTIVDSLRTLQRLFR